MNRELINQLAFEASQGNEESRDKLFREVTPLIERHSKRLEPFMVDATKFDCSVLRELYRHLRNFDPTSHDFLKSAHTVITRRAAEFRRTDTAKKDAKVSLNNLESPSEESESPGYQFEDKRDSPEQQLEYKEMTALLAQDDRRKSIILEQWSKGATDLSISDLLAQVLGGTAETHRKFVQRYRKTCRETIEANYDADSLCYA